jgi:hypothetical protein
MRDKCLAIIRSKIALNAWQHEATDVYKLASELIRDHSNYTENQLVEMIVSAAHDLTGTAILFHKPEAHDPPPKPKSKT